MNYLINNKAKTPPTEQVREAISLEEMTKKIGHQTTTAYDAKRTKNRLMKD